MRIALYRLNSLFSWIFFALSFSFIFSSRWEENFSFYRSRGKRKRKKERKKNKGLRGIDRINEGKFEGDLSNRLIKFSRIWKINLSGFFSRLFHFFFFYLFFLPIFLIFFSLFSKKEGKLWEKKGGKEGEKRKEEWSGWIRGKLMKGRGRFWKLNKRKKGKRKGMISISPLGEKYCSFSPFFPPVVLSGRKEGNFHYDFFDFSLVSFFFLQSVFFHLIFLLFFPRSGEGEILFLSCSSLNERKKEEKFSLFLWERKKKTGEKLGEKGISSEGRGKKNGRMIKGNYWGNFPLIYYERRGKLKKKFQIIYFEEIECSKQAWLNMPWILLAWDNDEYDSFRY